MLRTRRAFDRPWFALSSMAILSAACSSSPSSTGFDPDSGGGGSFLTDGGAGSDDDDDDAGGGGGGFGDGSTATDDCSDAAKLVYVISDTNGLYSFAPSALKFTKIGDVSCPSSGTVNSMAVDRSGTAWVNYTDGKIYKVSTTDASCTTTTFAPNQANFSNELGMGFSSNSAGSKAETLFVGDNNGLGVAKVDLTTLKLTALGAYTGSEAGANAELTGTGDARLFAFFATSPAAFAQVDKSSGATPAVTSLPTVNASDGGYAFSFWGGDFWFYTAYPTPDKPDATTSVTHYVTATKTATVALSEIGFVIVGAGVSTCAPVAPPK